MDYEAGDVIVYQTFGGSLRRVRVEQRLSNVKRGRPGFDGTVVSGPEKGMPVWGYDYQIVPLRLVATPPDRASSGQRSTTADREPPDGRPLL